jgi:hypothetical protein
MLMRWPVCLLRHDDRQLRMVIRIWGTPIADLCGPLTRVTNARLRPGRAVLRGWAAPAGEPVDMSSVLCSSTARGSQHSEGASWESHGASARARAIRPPQWPLLDWGRYGDLFDFDANTGQLTLGHSRDSHGH